MEDGTSTGAAQGQSHEAVLARLEKEVESRGLECHPFKIGWYNAKVNKPFHLSYHEDTLAVVVISAPSMFEKLFLPYLTSSYKSAEQLDPLDQCLRDFFNHMRGLFPEYKVEVLQDFELHATRRPKVLVQTAGHVAGVARYYQRADVLPDPWTEKQKIFGVSVHPKYGGWFALRGVLVFCGLLAPTLVHKEPVDCVPTHKKRIELLEKFNFHWEDWNYRDVAEYPIVELYSEEQRLYFATKPGERLKLVAGWLNKDPTTSPSS